MSDLGVVDPIRLPSSVDRAVRSVPFTALLFIVLAVIDVVGRAIGAIAPRLEVDHASLVTIAAAFLPHDLLILLPAVVLIRRRTADADTPWIFRGAVIVALVELLWRPTATLLTDAIAPDAASDVVWLYAMHSVLVAAGWVTLGWGVAALDPREPQPFPVGLANLTAGIIVAAIGASFLLLWLLLVTESSVYVTEPTYLVGPAASMLTLLAWAYLARTVVRGLGDPNRPRLATTVGTIGVVLSAIATLALVVLDVAVTVNQGLGGVSVTTVGASIAFVGEPVAVSLLVVAFGLGLGDPSRPVGSAWDAASRAPLADPAPGAPA